MLLNTDIGGLLLLYILDEEATYYLDHHESDRPSRTAFERKHIISKKKVSSEYLASTQVAHTDIVERLSIENFIIS